MKRRRSPVALGVVVDSERLSMLSFRGLAWRVFALLACALALATPIESPVSAAEPVEDFLRALRERRYFEEALDYLAALENSPLASDEVKRRLPMERVSLLIDAARSEPDQAARQVRLEEAQQTLAAVMASANGADRRQASKQFGLLLQTRGKMAVDTARKKQSPDAALMKEARGYFEQAIAGFEKRGADATAQLAKFPKVLDPATQGDQIAERRDLRTTVAESRLLVAAATEEMAQTHPEGSVEQKKLLQAAGAEYGKIAAEYRRQIPAAQMFQGRTLARLGEHAKALTLYLELLDDTSPELADLRTEVLELAAASWLDPSRKEYRALIERVGKWLDRAGNAEERKPIGLGLRVALAKALAAQAQELQQANPKAPEVKKLLADAHREATFAARYPSEHQAEAKELLAAWGASARDPSAAPETFAEARDAGLKSMEAGQKADEAHSIQERDAAWLAASERFQLALRLADEETPVDQVNWVRCQAALAAWRRGEYFDAALFGQFLADRYPQSAGAKAAASIAMSAYVKLYQDAGAENALERERLVQVCRRIAQVWPDQPEAVSARATLIPFTIADGRVSEALELLGKIPETAPERAKSELKVGQALWAAYVSGLQKNQTADPAIEEFRRQAEAVLSAGIARMEAAGGADPAMPTARLFLAMICVDANRPKEALAILEDPTHGALALLANNDPAATSAFAIDTLQTALRTYISLLPLAQPSEADSLMAKAKGAMKALGERVDREGKERLIGHYSRLARDLEKQLTIAPPAERVVLSKGFETFLDQVGSESDDLSTLYWVGETYQGMGERFGAGQARLPPDAERYFASAVSAYRRILDRGDSFKGGDGVKDWLPASTAVYVRLRLAAAERRRGQFKAAIDAYYAVLAASPESNRQLSVQIDAARTYQEWAAVSKPDLYKLAMLGARPDEKKRNVIWGWGQLAKVTSSAERFAPEFHEARYNLAVCRYELARRLPKEQRRPLLELAKKDITVTERLYPDLGGETQWRQYDELLKRIQSDLGEAAQGLAAIVVEN